MKLYGNAAAPTTQMLMIAITEKGHSPNLVEIDLSKGEQRSDSHQLRHPFGVTPVLEDENGFLYEARAMLRYIDRVLPGPALTPAAPRDYGLMEQFIGVEQSYFTPNIMVHFYSKFLGRHHTAEALQAGTAGAAKALDVVEANLARGPYLAGETFSLADIAWMPYLRITQATGNGELLQSRPRVNDWATRLLGRASFRQE
jgi:glutathione S-transferase